MEGIDIIGLLGSNALGAVLLYLLLQERTARQALENRIFEMMDKLYAQNDWTSPERPKELKA